MSQTAQPKEKRTFKQELLFLKDKRIRAYCINCISQYLLPLFGMYSCTSFMTTRLGFSAILVATLALIGNGIGIAMGFIVGPLIQSVNLNKKKDRLYNWLQTSKYIYTIAVLVMFFNLQLFGSAGTVVATICYFTINFINPSITPPPLPFWALSPARTSPPVTAWGSGASAAISWAA